MSGGDGGGGRYGSGCGRAKGVGTGPAQPAPIPPSTARSSSAARQGRSASCHRSPNNPPRAHARGPRPGQVLGPEARPPKGLAGRLTARRQGGRNPALPRRDRRPGAGSRARRAAARRPRPPSANCVETRSTVRASVSPSFRSRANPSVLSETASNSAAASSRFDDRPSVTSHVMCRMFRGSLLVVQGRRGGWHEALRSDFGEGRA